MKKISVLSPDSVPFILSENCPSVLTIDNKTFFTKDKYSRATSFGIRAWNIAKKLSTDDSLSVTLFVPENACPKLEWINLENIKFTIQPYHTTAATFNWSEELDKKLKNQDFVIIQSSYGVGYINCSVLPNSINVILDGYIPVLAEYPAFLIGNSSISRKVSWNKFIEQYVSLLKRANCILYANDNQLHYYEGQLFAIGKLDWGAYQFSPLLKVSYGIGDKNVGVKKRESTKLKLIWFGCTYPWYYPEKLLEEINNLKNIEIDFVSLMHPRYSKSYRNYFKKFFDSCDNSNVTVHEEYTDNINELFNDYDAGIVLSRDWLEENYSVRGRALDMLSHKLPVIMNVGNPLFHEMKYLTDSIYPVSLNNIVNDLNKYSAQKDLLEVSDNSFEIIKNKFNWDTVLNPLLDYIKTFGANK